MRWAYQISSPKWLMHKQLAPSRTQTLDLLLELDHTVNPKHICQSPQGIDGNHHSPIQQDFVDRSSGIPRRSESGNTNRRPRSREGGPSPRRMCRCSLQAPEAEEPHGRRCDVAPGVQVRWKTSSWTTSHAHPALKCVYMWLI